MSEVLNNIPIIILKETTILPGVMVHFDVMEKKSMLALDTAMNSGQKLVLLTEKNSSATELDETCIEKRGLLVSIKQIAKLPNGSRRVLVAEGVRVNFLDFAQKSPFISADVEIAEFSYEISKPEYIAAMRVMKQLIGEYALVNEKFKEGASKELLKIPHLDAQLHQAAIYIPTNKKDIQNIINANSIIEEFQIVSKIYYQEIDIAKVKNSGSCYMD